MVIFVTTAIKNLIQKKNIIRHLKHEHSELKIKCSFENCDRSYKILKCFSKHLKNDHNIDINTESPSFNILSMSLINFWLLHL